MKEPIDDTAVRLGKILCDARRSACMPHDEVARLLRIMPDELLEYERGVAKMPKDVLLWIITLGYRLLRMRAMEKQYHCQRQIFNKLKDVMATAE